MDNKTENHWDTKTAKSYYHINTNIKINTKWIFTTAPSLQLNLINFYFWIFLVFFGCRFDGRNYAGQHNIHPPPSANIFPNIPLVSHLFIIIISLIDWLMDSKKESMSIPSANVNVFRHSHTRNWIQDRKNGITKWWKKKCVYNTFIVQNSIRRQFKSLTLQSNSLRRCLNSSFCSFLSFVFFLF